MTNIKVARQSTVDAIQQAVAEISRTTARADLFGFGLCTDDDVSTLYHVYATRSWVAERETDDPEIGLSSVEWTQSADDALFHVVSDILQKWAWIKQSPATRGYDEERTARFHMLVEAMDNCRTEGLFDPQTLLSVCSTDPDELMVKQSCDAARQLNTAEIAAAYCRMMRC